MPIAPGQLSLADERSQACLLLTKSLVRIHKFSLTHISGISAGGEAQNKPIQLVGCLKNQWAEFS